ncbi:MAG: type II toxin-antitoxin system RelE family toxin [Candidatus Methylomirabilis sp.]
MRYEIILAPEAVQDMHRLPARDRSRIREALERHLRYEPSKESRTSIKRLRGIVRPQYRLRVGEFRVFYDVSQSSVEILAVVPKSQVEGWLKDIGGQQ